MRLIAVVVSLAAAAFASPVVFPDSQADRPDPAGSLQRYGQERGSQHAYQDTGGYGAIPQRYASATATLPPPPADSEGRLLFQHKKKKKKKKVICGLAGLLAGRDAAGGVDGRDLEQQHRSARAAPVYPGQQQGQQGVLQDPKNDGRSYGSGLGVAGFLLGTFVGSKLGYGFAQHPQGLHGVPGHVPVPVPPAPLAPTQTQTQVQVLPVVPIVPVPGPAPVHENNEDYDQVEDDPSVYSGGSSLCQQLQQRPDPGPLDSHFPLIHGLLSGAGQQQRPVYRPPPPRPPPHYGYYNKPNLLYSYLKPWTDLLFKR